ncbi:MAG: LamG-like jellyroll fold domain-containing protein [Isosphaeraceae bacterium]|nr:LamG-like jellyroll fold domain-containing protein [Isosphaeraceae bacterium]
MSPILRSIFAAAACLCVGLTSFARAADDPRRIQSGRPIPSEGYADQPYIVKTNDGAWLCVMTTGKGAEGAAGQHVVSMRSRDQGRTWEPPVSLEPADGPEASYAVLLRVPSGRIYAFYNHNTDRVAEVKREDRGVYKRVDSLGHHVFKFTDDGGKTWSPRRYEVPIREFDIDRENIYGGELRFFWNVGRPLIHGDSATMILHKVGAMGEGFFARSEGAFFKSRNILTETDPTKIVFETLPEGRVGLRTPPGGGRVAEEQSLVVLGDGSLYCVYRTIDGWPASSYSRDGGRTWSTPAYASYTPGGRRIKHPRAANFAWNCSKGRFLYWFHNHGGRFVGELGAGGKDGRSPYDDRNPAWLAAGREVDTPAGRMIEWSQPEIVLYDDDPYIRMSYPDLIEDGGKFFLTETQKSIGRVHEIPSELVGGLFAQFENDRPAAAGLLLDADRAKLATGSVAMPKLPDLNRRDTKSEDFRGLDLRAGFSIELAFEPTGLKTGRTLLDTRDQTGAGIAITAEDSGAVKIVLDDGRQSCAWSSDPGSIAPGRPAHVVVTVDGGPKIITFVINGVLSDGGDARQFGWGRYSPTLRTPRGSSNARIDAAVGRLRIYGRALRTSEAVGNHRSLLRD